MAKHKSEAEFLAEKLKKYVGWKLIGVVTTEDPADGYDSESNVCLILERGGVVAGFHILRDPEGNGPGWVDVVETTNESSTHE